jgi:hypothetical protein
MVIETFQSLAEEDKEQQIKSETSQENYLR